MPNLAKARLKPAYKQARKSRLTLKQRHQRCTIHRHIVAKIGTKLRIAHSLPEDEAVPDRHAAAFIEVCVELNLTLHIAKQYVMETLSCDIATDFN